MCCEPFTKATMSDPATMEEDTEYRSWCHPAKVRLWQQSAIVGCLSVIETLGWQIILGSVHKLAANEAEFNMIREQEAWVISIMVSVTVMKLLLAVYCPSFTNDIVKAYAQDHLFDVIRNVIGLMLPSLQITSQTGWILLMLYLLATLSIATGSQFPSPMQMFNFRFRTQLFVRQSTDHHQQYAKVQFRRGDTYR